MPFGLQNLVDSLAHRDLILPYFESGMLADNWPDFYDVRVDSRVYYGLGDGYFHPSTHPMMGERQLYYMFHPDTAAKMVPERNHLRRQMWLAMGSALHAVLQTQMNQVGLIRDFDTDVEWEYVNEAHHVRGRIDWIVHHPNGQIIPVEFKSQNTWDYSRDKEPVGARAQLNLGLDAYGADFGVLIVAERGGNFDMHETPVHRDQQLLEKIYSKFDRVREAIAANTPPRHCCGIGDTVVINDCPARFQCWLKEEK